MDASDDSVPFDQQGLVELVAVVTTDPKEQEPVERVGSDNHKSRSGCEPSILLTSSDLEEEGVPLVMLEEGETLNEKSRLKPSSKSTWHGTLKNVCLFSCGLALVSFVVILFLLLSDTNFFQDLGFGLRNSENHVERPILAFRKKQSTGGRRKEFKILQITDIHLGEAEDLDWGPRQDRNTWHALDSILKVEAPVDLLILGGDQLTGNNCEKNGTAYYEELGHFLSSYGKPWATIFGNHDDTEYEAANGERRPALYSRKDLVIADQKSPLSLTQMGPDTIDGTSNYMLDVHDSSGTDVIAQVLLLDSGGGAIPKKISDSQIAWVREQISTSDVPAVAFQHIPTQAHKFFDDSRCQGLHDDGVEVVGYDGGIMQALSATNRFFFLGVGHMHGMGYCCPYESSDLPDPSTVNQNQMHVCFGRHSGYGGYGRWERGCRVYELYYDDDETEARTTPSSETSSKAATRPIMQWSSWVRLESGEIVDKMKL